MKNKIVKVIILALALVLIFGTVSSFAFNAYDTYTYSIDGTPLKSPTAYEALDSFDSISTGISSADSTGIPIVEASDLFADEDGKIYIADKGSNRIIILNKFYQYEGVISTWQDEFGRTETFLKPSGVFVSKRLEVGNTDDPYMGKYIYVCDTDNGRIVKFTPDCQYVETITCPVTPLIDVSEFKPSAVAVDKYGRIFIVSKTATQGIIVLAEDGSFTGFIGAQKVAVNLIDQLLNQFKSDEEKDASIKNISAAYNNIAVDDDGFIYVTTDDIKYESQLSAIKSKSADYSPLKKFNSTGKEILKRNGFFDPGGEVVTGLGQIQPVLSSIVDVTLGPEGTYTILDSSKSRQRLFTYDQDGNLLFAFGGMGKQLGNGASFVAVAYQNFDDVARLVTLDNSNGTYKITVFEPTDYCDSIIAALANQNNHNYNASIDYWQDVLTKNNNFDLAYIGIGKALHNQGKYADAYSMLQKSYEVDYSSKAFAEMRKDVVGNWLLAIVAGVVILAVLLVKFLGYAKKKNKAATLKVGRKTYLEELLFVFHLVFHPFDGFWDLKHEQRGSVRGATTILGITVLAFFYNSIGQGYLFNPRGAYSNVFATALSIIVPVALWVVGNWGLTTLFDGEGSFKDVYVTTCYSLAPMPLFVVISTILSNVMIASEGTMVTLVISIGFVWVAILLFFGTLVTHNYSLGKNVITVLGTIVAMVIIMFIAILFSSLVVKMVQFLVTIISEIGNRI